jgi:hypothetical protein
VFPNSANCSGFVLIAELFVERRERRVMWRLTERETLSVAMQQSLDNINENASDGGWAIRGS